ncbi:hypothetical protein AK95_03150 [Paenibacillus sp. LC231]|uniref:LpxL/LpxP family acyltransferase n=1 Tax=Paenibacillus sp. LC231 TaxID=1120679 RepID=UPI0008DDED69|nr:hypothetical protein [Paenibacillus sp. LC231]OIB01915.1 hypothetical protein AK95_03150 [Paenibacillus sp. LC231]
MGNIKDLSFPSLSTHIDELMRISKEELLSLCSDPEAWRVSQYYSIFVENNPDLILKHKEFLAQRPMHWSLLIKLLKEKGIDNSFLNIPTDITRLVDKPCIFVIPHFGLHMLVPLILAHFIESGSHIVASGMEDGMEVANSVNEIFPDIQIHFNKIPDIWILRKLYRAYNKGNYPVIYPELTASDDKSLFQIELLGEKLGVPRGVENLSRLCKSNVIPVAMTYDKKKYELHLGPMLSYSEEGSILTPLFVWIEKLIEQHPDQWFGWQMFDEMMNQKAVEYA